MTTSHCPQVVFWAVLGICVVSATTPPVAAQDKGRWEPFPDGSTGQVTEYHGVKNTPIAAYLRKPNGDGPFPAVVMIHGGGDSKEGTYQLGRMTAAPTANFLAQGWAVFSIDFRPRSPFQPIEWDDACQAVAALRAMPFIDGKRIAMFGGSHGGYNTVRAAARCDLACAVPCAPAAIDLAEVAKAKAAGFKLSPNLERVLANPPASGAPGVFQEAESVRCPLLLVSGRNDSSSPPSVMEAYAAKLRAAGKEVELYLPENGPHGFYFGRPRIAQTDVAARRAVEFIAKHFNRPAQSAAATPAAASAAPSRSAANSIDRLEKSWVDPDETEPAGTKYNTFHSATIRGAVSYLIYLPPDYDSAKDRRYPALYWLHGTGGKQSRAAEVVKRLDEAIRAGQAPPMIVVLVNGLRGATMYCDTKDGQWPLESVLMKDLIPHVDAAYRTVARREARAVEGFSMGGFGAAHLGFKYPEVFGVVSILAPALLGPEVKIRWEEHFSYVFQNDLAAYEAENPFELAAKNADKLRARSIIRLVPHDEPGKWLIPRCDQLHAVLEKHNIPHEYDPRRDVRQHNYVLLYDALGERALGFYAQAFAGVGSDAKPSTERTQASTSAASDGRAAQLFERLDANRDDKIDASEAASEPGKRFSRMFDRNGDGIVTREEIGAADITPTTAPVGAPTSDQRGASVLLRSKTFPSAVLKAQVSYTLYLPPSYAREAQRRYPVVFWLHGGGGASGDCWKFVEAIDAAIKAANCPEMIVVGVDGRSRGAGRVGSQYSDWKDGTLPMETAIIKELLPHIDATYRTLGTREGRALEGFSMGGHGALHLAFRHPELFGAVTAIGPALIMPRDGGNRVQEVYQNGAYKGDEAYWREHDPLTLAQRNAEALRARMFIRLITGEAEGNFTNRRTIELSEALKRLGIEHEFVRPGETGHNYVQVYEAMPTGYEFYVNAFGKVTQPPNTPPPHAARPSPDAKATRLPHAAEAAPQPPICYDITKSYPGEIGQYRVSRAARPVEPFEIMDGLYYVGNTQVSAHLLKTGDGLILIDSTMPHEVPWLLESIRKLGFQPSDVKVVIGTHAHLDHIGGHWYFQEHVGAQTWLQAEDAADTETGAWRPGKLVELDGAIATLSRAFPPFKTDRALRDGEVVEWGGRTLAFRRAPGHTPGTLMIELSLRGRDGKTLQAGLLGGLSPGRPEFTATCRQLRELEIDIWLGAHPQQNRTLEKAGRLATGQGVNPFIDAQGWQDFLDRMIAR